MTKQLHIFYAFISAGLLGFGGGPAVIPILEKSIVKKYKIMDLDEFMNTIAIANTLPGPIATKLAGYIGYRAGGLMGMLNAILSMVLPTVIAVIILIGGLQQFKDIPFVNGMTKGVLIVVCAMMISLMVEFIKQSHKKLGWTVCICLLALSAIAMIVFQVHPGFVIALLLIIAFVAPVRGAKKA